MFYPRFFPNGSNGVSPATTFRAESDAAFVLVTGDRGWFRHVGRDGILPGLLHELRFMGAFWPEEGSGVEALLAANAEPLLRFVEEEVLPSEPSVHWEWRQPDWAKVRETLGEEVAEEAEARFGRDEEAERQRRAKVTAVA